MRRRCTQTNLLQGFKFFQDVVTEFEREEGSSTAPSSLAAHGSGVSSFAACTAAYREFQVLLDALDSKHEYGGLQRVTLLEDGQVHWLCDKHAAQYEQRAVPGSVAALKP